MTRKYTKAILSFFIITLIGTASALAQVEYRWLSVGSFHNFYGSIGSEIEEGFIDEQQGGWQWPAIYRGQDAQAAKAFWIGARNFTDESGNNYAARVVHVGPRVTGLSEFYPMEFTSTSKFAPPEVVVDGLESFGKSIVNDVVDPSIPADRQIVSVNNTLLGVTVTRRAMQFSQQYHDNYHVIEYTYTNTGNTDNDPEIELPANTIEDMYAFFHYRMAPVKASRYTIGNGTGWGLNTMNDRRGDGLVPGEPETFRAQFAWHGNFPPFTAYDNVGGPIWIPNTTGGWLSEADTSGRLVAYHFVGSVTLHADTSPSDDTDDVNQPSTMTELHSDDGLTRNNSAFDIPKMNDEYDLMQAGRTAPRHAYKIEPSGLDGFLEPTGDPATGAPAGGWSYVTGYGPYTLAPGESVRIVVAEASAGISRQVAEETGVAFKAGEITAREKNEVVFQSRDSLFQTFERAVANYQSGYTIPEAPMPPSRFFVSSAGDGIQLEWEFEGNEADIDGFQIYRATARVDSAYSLVYTALPSQRSVSDGDIARDEDPGAYFASTPSRGIDYYYYIVTLGKTNNDGTGNTPTGSRLISNRHYTQSYDPARLLRQAGENMSEIRVVPNPYRASNLGPLGFKTQVDDPERIAFYEIPGRCTIEIYTELGERIRTIQHTNGSGDEFWDLRTDYRQLVVSGIYIARIINEDPASPEFGSVVTRKIVIIL